MELWEHQKRGVEAYLNGSRLLAFDVGMGKTRMALAILSILKNQGVTDCLVIAPISAHDTWKEESKMCGISIDIMSYQLFLSRDLHYGKYEMVIFDEIHKLKSSKAKTVKKVNKTFNNTNYKLGLSGTTISKHHEIYSQVNVLDQTFWKQYGIHSYTQFLNRFFACHPNFHYPMYPHKGAIKDIEKMIEPIVLTMKRDESKLPEVQYIHKKFNIKMPKLSELMDLGDFQRTMILAGGFDENKKMFDNNKLNFLIDNMEESEQNSIIFCRFIHEAEAISKAVGDCYIITGSNKEHLGNALSKQDKPIVATYCLKEGANLQGYNQIYFYSIPVPHRDYYQSIGRVYRSGQKNKVVVYHLLGGWIDEHIMNLINKGENALSNFMRRFDNVRNKSNM